MREVFVDETDEAVEAADRESLMSKWESYVEWGQDEVIESDDFDFPWDKLCQKRFIVESPETAGKSPGTGTRWTWTGCSRGRSTPRPASRTCGGRSNCLATKLSRNWSNRRRVNRERWAG